MDPMLYTYMCKKEITRGKLCIFKGGSKNWFQDFLHISIIFWLTMSFCVLSKVSPYLSLICAHTFFKRWRWKCVSLTSICIISTFHLFPWRVFSEHCSLPNWRNVDTSLWTRLVGSFQCVYLPDWVCYAANYCTAYSIWHVLFIWWNIYY